MLQDQGRYSRNILNGPRRVAKARCVQASVHVGSGWIVLEDLERRLALAAPRKAQVGARDLRSRNPRGPLDLVPGELPLRADRDAAKDVDVEARELPPVRRDQVHARETSYGASRRVPSRLDGSALNHQHNRSLWGARSVHDAVRHHHAFIRAQLNHAALKLDGQAPTHDVEEVVFPIVLVEVELALEDAEPHDGLVHSVQRLIEPVARARGGEGADGDPFESGELDVRLDDVLGVLYSGYFLFSLRCPCSASWSADASPSVPQAQEH